MRKSYYLLSLFTLLLLSSCYNDNDFTKKESIEEIAIEDHQTEKGDQIILGKKLQNPYSVINMRKALRNLKNRGQASRELLKLQISTTHRYIKFKPKDSVELKQLEADSSLIIYDYPLDYEIVQMGDSYHDPSVPLNKPTYQYASLKQGKTIPTGVAYEILSDLYIPDEEDISDKVSDLLVDEALQLTDNLGQSNDLSATARASKWRPAGRIMVWDSNIGSTTTSSQVFSHWEYYDCDNGGGGLDEIQENNNTGQQQQAQVAATQDLIAVDQCRRAVYTTVYNTIPGSYVPVHGVKVRARRWFTTRTGITNSQGYYSCNGRFRRPANYKIKWKRHQFSIWWSWLSSAKYNGPKKRGDWNLNIKGGTQEYYATIFRAAHHYYYENIKGLRRPPLNTFWRTKMKIRAYKQNVSEDNALGTHTAGWRAFGLYAPIKIYTYQRPSRDTYMTTLHELAHASHWHMNRSAFRDSETRVKESWARGVQWDIGRMVYPDYRGGATIRPDYTQVVVDMIDTPSDVNNGIESTSIDNVQGYTIRQIEDAINGRTSWNSWRDNIKSRYNNATEVNLDALFSFWD